jgi:PAS domain S-box-containing protein
MNRSARVNRAGSALAADQDMGEEFRVIAEISGDVAFSIDCASGLPRYISPSAEYLLGYGPQDFHDHFSGTRAAPALQLLCGGLTERLARFAAGDRTRTRLVREFDVTHRSGHIVPVEVISTLMLDHDGAPRSLVGMVRDLSPRRAREQEQKRFASMLNHEFRTPLSTIDGAIQRLEATNTTADEPTRQRYRKIAVAVDRLIGMLDDYLSPERMAALGSQRRENTVGPKLLLEELVAQARVAGRPVTLAAGDLPAALRGEPSGLRLALKVLLDNALRYTPAGTALHAAGRRADGGVELALRDEGHGVPPDDVAHIFDKGYRGANTEGVAGSGLGLYMARSVVEVHGGSLTYACPPEGGAEFRLWLPAQESGAKSLASGMTSSDNRNGDRG